MAPERDKLALKHLEELIKEDVPGYIAKYKNQDKWSLRLSKLFRGWLDSNTTLYPAVYYTDEARRDDDPRAMMRTMEHEWVHLKDAETLNGLLPKKLKWLSLPLWYLGYMMPIPIAALAVLAFWNPWWLLALAGVAPLPSPMRMWAELRAWRRNCEWGSPIEVVAKVFTTKKYYWMWPFKRHIMRLLKEESPYKQLMDEAQTEAYRRADEELADQ